MRKLRLPEANPRSPVRLPPFEVGVDAGGTRTRALVRRVGGRVVGSAEGGAANVHGVGLALAVKNLSNTIRSAMRDAAVTVRSTRRIAIGAAGLGDLPTRRAVQRAIESRFPQCEVFVTSDAEVALAATGLASPYDAYIALIAGTGSIAIGTDGRRIVRAGGYGFRLGDEGSASWIGKQALSAVSRALDRRGPKTRLEAAVLAALKCDRAGFRVAAHRAAERASSLGAIAPLVVECSAHGDRVARSILRAAGAALGELVAAVASQLADSKHEPMTVCSFGGVVENVPIVTNALRKALRNDAPRCRFVRWRQIPAWAVLEMTPQ